MNIYEILRKKRIGKKLEAKEIEFLVKGYYYGNIPDYQMSAFLTSTVINGMDEEEIFAFTKTMVETGEIMNFSEIEGIKIDKHSTGGVGDTVSLIAIPILACMGYKVPKLSGRALGHTGGTIDKLESIPNIVTNLGLEEMRKALREVGAFICQPFNLAPADKKIYALRDVTANVDSIPLIASSIMSKKIAANSDVIILDVKVGNGAFMSNYQDAFLLAETMIKIGKKFGKICAAAITDMNQPLNNHIGNTLEIISAIDFLKGNYNKYPRLKKVCFNLINLAKYILDNLDKIRNSLSINEVILNQNGFQYIENIINQGQAINKLKEIIQFQKGDPNFVDDPYKYFEPKIQYSFYSSYEGYIDFDTYLVGLAAGELGLSRKTIDDKIDNNSGIILKVSKGDFVKNGQIIADLYAKDEKSLEDSLKLLEKAIKFSTKPCSSYQEIYKIMVY